VQARRNAEKGVDGRPYTNVEFHLATIDALPLSAGSVDCIISNCVINLAPDKKAVFREIARVLKPDGRLAVSDIALKQPLPAEIGNDLLAYVGCVAGAILIDDYRRDLIESGLAHVQIVETGSDLNVYALAEGTQSAACGSGTELPVASTGCCAPGEPSLRDLLARYNVNDYAASVRVYAVKP